MPNNKGVSNSDISALKIGPPANAAAGFGATLQVVKQWSQHMRWSRGWSVYRTINQYGGFDCPGCAWPEPERHRSAIEFCENGAKALGEEATSKTIGEAFFRRHSIYALSKQSDYWLGQQGRLAEPLIKLPGAAHYSLISWPDAIEYIATHLRGLEDPNHAIFYTSGRASNEAAFLYQLFARKFGTNNLPDSSNLCHESSGVALKEVIGLGKGTVRLEDFAAAGCILVIGQNPGTNHPRMLGALEACVKNGGKVISINPLQEAGLKALHHPKKPWHSVTGGTKLASRFLQVKVNGDVALFKGLAKAILETKALRAWGLDQAFIDEYTSGFNDYTEAIAATSWEEIGLQSGVDKADIVATAEDICTANGVIACWAMGITQHVNAVANIQEIVNLLMLGGNLGKPGAGVCPVRGHSNVQGDRTMGITASPPPEFITHLKAQFSIKVDDAPGLDAVSAISAMYENKGHVFVALGGNFQAACPDTAFTSKALENCRLTVQISTKLNRSHLVTGEAAIILPCLGRTDIDLNGKGQPQWITTENSMGFVSRSQGVVAARSLGMRSEVAIVSQIAEATLEPDEVDWSSLAQNYSLIRDYIADVVPGFRNFNARLASGIGFYLPNAVHDHRCFVTVDSTARFTVHPMPNSAAGQGEYRLMTIRSHDQFNTTIYGLDDRYRGVYGGRNVLFMQPDDMADKGFNSHQLVDIQSNYDGEIRQVSGFSIVPYDIPRGCLAAYYPETNALIPLSLTAEKSNTPASKLIWVNLLST